MITIRTCTTRAGTIEWEVPQRLEEKLKELPLPEREKAERRICKMLRRLAFLRACAENSLNAEISHRYIDTEIETASNRIFDICGNPGHALDMAVMSKYSWTPPYKIEEMAAYMKQPQKDIVIRRLHRGTGFYVLMLTLSEIDPKFKKGLKVLGVHLHKAARNLGILLSAEKAIKH